MNSSRFVQGESIPKLSLIGFGEVNFSLVFALLDNGCAQQIVTNKQLSFCEFLGIALLVFREFEEERPIERSSAVELNQSGVHLFE